MLQLLSAKDKAKGTWIVGLMGLNAILDFFSLASFLPLIFLLVNPEFISSNKYFRTVYSLFNFTSPSTLIIATAGCALAFVMFKTLIANWITRSKVHFCFQLGSDLSSRLLSKYMEITYHRFTQSDFTKELNRIASLPIAFANNIVMPLANLLSEGLVFLILFFCIALYDVKILALLILLLVPIGLVYAHKRKGLSQTSNELKANYPLSLKYALQAIEGWVDIKAFGKESFFENRFTKTSRELARTFSNDHTHQTGAARLTEVIAAVVMSSLIVYAVITNKNYQETFILLGIYAGASFRMIPSINRILNAFLQIKSHHYLFEELNVLSDFQTNKNQGQSLALKVVNTIAMKNISFRYTDGPIVLNDISFTIHQGERIGLVGKSGSGKTTILMILLQFLKQNSGELFINGIEVKDEYRDWNRIFSYVPQNPYILDGTIAENIAFGFSSSEIDVEKIENLVRDLDFHEMINQFADGLSTAIGEKGIRLSGGQRQRIAIARALYSDAPVLLLDEITSQLDEKTEEEVLQTLKKVTEQNKTLIMITHSDHLQRLFDRILFLENGKIIERLPINASAQ